MAIAHGETEVGARHQLDVIEPVAKDQGLMTTGADQLLQPGHRCPLVHAGIGDVYPLLVGRHYIGLVITLAKLAPQIQAAALLVIEGDLHKVRGDVAKIGDRLHLGVGATHQGFQMIRHLLPDRRAGRRAGDDDMLTRQTLQPTDDGQAQGVTQQRLIDVAPLVLDAGGTVFQDPEIRALRPQPRLDPVDLFSRAGRKMYPLLRHGGNHLGEQGSVVIPPCYMRQVPSISVMMSLIMLLPRMYAC